MYFKVKKNLEQIWNKTGTDLELTPFKSEINLKKLFLKLIRQK